MKRLTIALFAPLFIALAPVSYAELPNDISAAGISSYDGMWLRADDKDMPGAYQIKIKKINDTEFNVELTKPRVQNRYNYSDQITYVTKNFTAILKDGVLHIDNGGMEMATLTYHPETQSIQTTKSWSFPNGVFTQSGDTPVQMASQIPAYKARKLIEESLWLATSAKNATVEHYASYGEFPQNNAEAGLAKPEDINSKGVKSVAIEPEGKIVITYTEEVSPQAPATITITTSDPNESGRGSFVWKCRSENIPQNLLPKECANPVKAPAHKAKEYIATGLSLASSAKVAIAEYYANFGEYPANNAEAGLANAQDIIAKGVQSVAVAPEGKIIITYTEEINPDIPATITIQTALDKEKQRFVFTCTAQNIDKKLIPEECKAQ